VNRRLDTKEVLSQKKKEEPENSEAVILIQNEAVLLTINGIGQRISEFLKNK